MSDFPSMCPLTSDLIERVYPYNLVCDETQRTTVMEALKRFGVPLQSAPSNTEEIWTSDRLPKQRAKDECLRLTKFVPTPAHQAVLADMLQDHLAGRSVVTPLCGIL